MEKRITQHGEIIQRAPEWHYPQERKELNKNNRKTKTIENNLIVYVWNFVQDSWVFEQTVTSS